MTKNQERGIERIREDALKWAGPEGELKRFEVEEISGKTVAVWAIVGRKNDEGTYAQIFCRDSVHVFIGPRGAMRCPVNTSRTKDKYRQGYIPYTSFFSVSYMQNKKR